MRKSLLLLSAIALFGTANAQIVFSSGFENWNDTLPTDWVGDKTNLNFDSITQVTANVHGGTYAARIANPSSSNRRLTTLPMHMDAGTQYDFSFWVRGSGDIHVALYDARTGNSGYSSYSSYVIVTGESVWQEITASVLCENTTDVGEFIIGCRNTDAPENLVVDDVEISVGVVVPPEEASIYEIQYTAAPDGISPFDGVAVLTGGVVTGVDTIGADGYFIQNGQGPWTGVYVFDSGNTVAIGDSVTLQATVDEFNNKTELTGITNFTNHGPFPVPAPEVLTAGAAQVEQWEGVLVKIFDIGAATLPVTPNWEWNATSWQGDITVDDLMYLYTPVVGTYYTVTGIVDQYQTGYKLCPRQLSDIEIGSGIGEFAGHGVTVFPNPASTTLTLDIPNISGRTEYTLTDVSGRMALGAMINAERNTIDVSNLPAGMYALTLRNGASTWSTGVAVQR